MSSRRTLAPLLQLLFTSFTLGGLACGGDADNGESQGDLGVALANTVDQVIVPDFQALAIRSEALASNVEDFCAAPGVERLEAMQADWRTITTTWSGAAAYFVGPLDDDIITPSIYFIESMRQRGIDYTDTVREATEEALSGTEPITQEGVQQLTFDEVGLLALEVLLFEDTTEQHSTQVADIVADYVSRPRKCDYLDAMTSRFVDRVQRVRDGWLVGFGPTDEPYRDLLIEGRLPDGGEPVPELMLAVINHLTYVERRKLNGILDAQISGTFFANQAALLREVEAFLSAGDGYGFFDVMTDRGFEGDVEAIRRDLGLGIDAAEIRSRDQLAAIVASLAAELRQVIPSALGVDLGIDFSDGD